MAFIVQAPELKDKYSKLDRYVFVNKDISDGGCRLYGYMLGLKSGDSFSDEYMMKTLGISRAVLSKRKRELRKFKLLSTTRLDARTYVNFIGNTVVDSEMVKHQWQKRQDN